MITVDFDAAAITQALGELERRVSPEGLKEPLVAIGQRLAESTRQRFAAGTALVAPRLPRAAKNKTGKTTDPIRRASPRRSAESRTPGRTADRV